MRNRFRLILAPASVLLLGLAWAAGPDITPTSQDFGPVLITTAQALGGNSMFEFQVEVPPNPAAGTLKLTITGAGQKDYFVTPSTIDLRAPYAYSLQGVFTVGGVTGRPQDLRTYRAIVVVSGHGRVPAPW